MPNNTTLRMLHTANFSVRCFNAMCQCSQLPEAVLDLTYRENRNFNFLGAEQFSDYFAIPDESTFSPQFDYAINLYQCDTCGQKWYMELTPEEYPSIEFGMKYFSDIPPKKWKLTQKNNFCQYWRTGASLNACADAPTVKILSSKVENCVIYI